MDNKSQKFESVVLNEKSRPIILYEKDDEQHNRLLDALRGIGIKNTILRIKGKSAGEMLLENKGEYSKYTEELPGIIFMNIKQDLEEALDFCCFVKQNPLFKTIPIIGMTDLRDKELMDSCYTVGMNAVIVLPDNMEKFYQSLFRTIHFWYKTAKIS